MNEYNTFWRIIHDNEIVIPTIQRDYAYGREEAKSILKNLLISIIEALENETMQLHLAFVYGKLEGKKNDKILQRNSENIKSLLQSVKEYANDLDIIVNFDSTSDVVRLTENVKFIPIDGQQRLTTLFLVHWYLALHLNEKLALKTILRKFQYSTRISSKEFCELLCSMENNSLGNIINSDFVTNQEGYFKQWQKDPTVKNMLRVIDLINDAFKMHHSDFRSYWNLLTQTDRVCFDFFDLDTFQLTDELYVKMNSRGKKLTQFENFKAWLYHKKELDCETKKKIDISWYDMFWKAQNNNTDEIDVAYLQWFKNLFLSDFLKFLETQKNKELNDEFDLENSSNSVLKGINGTKNIITILRNGDGKFLELLISNQLVQDVFLNYIDMYLNKLSKIVSEYQNKLDIYINKEFYILNIKQLLFTEQKNLNWWQVTLQYAIIEYLSNNDCKETNLVDYLRVISNLIFNTAINGPNDYLLAIKSIDKIIEYCEGDIIKYFFDVNIDEISFFSSSQKEEEKIKAKKILNNIEWKDLIISAENNRYFYGQVGFIFNLLKVDSTTEFNLISRRIGNLFSPEILKRGDTFLFRALLSIIGKDIFISEENNIFRYPINEGNTLRVRNENWRRSLLNEDKISLLAQIILNKELDTIANLIILLENSIKNYPLNTSYLSVLIKNGKIFTDSPKHCFWIYNELRNQVYTMNTTSIRGYYRELFTMNWFLNNQNYKTKYPLIEISIKGLMHEVDNDCGLNVEFSNQDFLKVFTIYRNYDDSNFKLLKNDDSYKYEGIFTSSSIDELIENIINNKNGILN